MHSISWKAFALLALPLMIACPGSDEMRISTECVIGTPVGTPCDGGVFNAACQCVPCTEDAHCDGDAPYCDTSKFSCFECKTEAECDDGNACTSDACNDDGFCSGDRLPYQSDCGGGNVCNGVGECVACAENSDCSGATPKCGAASECVECLSGADCATGACSADNRCVTCVDNSTCNDPAHPVCNTATAMCVECVVASDCRDADGCLAPSCDANVCGGTVAAAGSACGAASDRVCNGDATFPACLTCLPSDPTCTVFYETEFEACPPSGWMFGTSWECGVPGVGPASVPAGSNVLGTTLAGNYASDLMSSVAFAQMPPVSLPASQPTALTYQHWSAVDDGSDGYWLQISVNGGATFADISSAATPAPTETIETSLAYGSVPEWERVQVDLSAFAGETILIRFVMASSSFFEQVGVYIDDVSIEIANTIPVSFATTSLNNAQTGIAYRQTLEARGGTGAGDWSLVGGTNTSWLSLDPASGVLSGTPTAAHVGPSAVTIRYEEPSNASNFIEQTFNFNVQAVTPITDFEATCATGWTLTGEWECGVPTSGPNAAFGGTNVLAIDLDDEYESSTDWGDATATFTLDLTARTAPTLEFRAWLDMESGFDGFAVRTSVDGGMTYQEMPLLLPTSTSLDGESAWSGRPEAWEVYQVDLSSLAGASVMLRFDMRSDSSVVGDGVYIDDLVLLD